MNWVIFNRDQVGNVILRPLGDDPGPACDCPPFPEFPWLTCLAAGLGIALGAWGAVVMEKRDR